LLAADDLGAGLSTLGRGMAVLDPNDHAAVDLLRFWLCKAAVKWRHRNGQLG